MTYGPGADIFGVPSPANLVADCRAAGFTVMGGYAYDDDVSMKNPWTSAHVDALTAEGIAFLPIITLRNGTTATVATLVASLEALGWTSGPVGWDREDATAVPMQAVMRPLVTGLRDAGYGPHIGYRYPYANVEAWYIALMDSVWQADPGGSETPGVGWEHCQYGSWKGHATYDLDTFTLEDLNDMTPQQAQQLQEIHAWCAGTGNEIYAIVTEIKGLAQAGYNWQSGTGNGLNAKLDQVISMLQPPPEPVK